MKIRPVGADVSMRTDAWPDGQTVRQTHDEANCGLSQFCECA